MFWLFLVLILAVIALLIYAFPLIEVCGDSMYPTLHDGDIILGFRLFHSLQVSRIYVYIPPMGGRYVIKRLSRISRSTGKLFFEGDNSENSYDSRNYGYVDDKTVVARYVLTIRRKECK